MYAHQVIEDLLHDKIVDEKLIGHLTTLIKSSIKFNCGTAEPLWDVGKIRGRRPSTGEYNFPFTNCWFEVDYPDDLREAHLVISHKEKDLFRVFSFYKAGKAPWFLYEQSFRVIESQFFIT